MRLDAGALAGTLIPALASAQPWKPFLDANRAIDWSAAGVGGIPPRTTVCARLTATATVTNIDAALAACPPGQTVLLQAGTYTIAGTIHIPANVTLRGAGADRTILNATGAGEAVIAMGNGDGAFGAGGNYRRREGRLHADRTVFGRWRGAGHISGHRREERSAHL